MVVHFTCHIKMQWSANGTACLNWGVRRGPRLGGGWCRYCLPVVFSFGSANRKSSVRTNPHHCFRTVCSHYMKIIPGPSQPSNMAAQSQFTGSQRISSNPSEMLYIHRGIWSWIENSAKYTGTDCSNWPDTMCSSKTSMQLAPFRVAGMD